MSTQFDYSDLASLRRFAGLPVRTVLIRLGFCRLIRRRFRIRFYGTICVCPLYIFAFLSSRCICACSGTFLYFLAYFLTQGLNWKIYLCRTTRLFAICRCRHCSRNHGIDYHFFCSVPRHITYGSRCLRSPRRIVYKLCRLRSLRRKKYRSLRSRCSHMSREIRVCPRC